MILTALATYLTLGDTEVLSEATKKPLLKVNLGRISAHKNWEQSLEQTFHNAESWKGILLIDEAEIVLEKRTFERLTQNSWISGSSLLLIWSYPI